MTILCPYCQSRLAIADYESHIVAKHPEKIEERALISILTAQGQVEYIYNHHPEAKQDNGILLFYFAKGYPKLRLYEQSVAGERTMLVSHMSEIRPEKDYPELSAICPNEMRYGTKSVLGNVPAPIQEVRNKSISRLHTDRDVCKESTDTSREATQGCSATLNPVMVPKPAPMATDEDGQRQKQSERGTPSLSVVGGCQIIQAPYDTFFYFLKRANSITRLGRHIRQPKKTGEELMPSPTSLKARIKTKDAVMQVLMEVPQARYNEGVLAEKVLRYFQPQGIDMHYSKETQEITLKAPKSLMLAVLRHIETISRASRKLRSTLKLEGSSAVPARREVEFGFSTQEWAQRSGNDWLPNTYVEMSD